MMGETSSESYVSDMTLALFEDSGWYIPNYDYSVEMQWGKNQGCSFL